jgi:4-amino-4-deoxy-L-arabinose transferase-like glycosyltransferase
MFSKPFRLTSIIVSLIIVFCFLTRFYKLNWGDGFFFQPDENNMASAISRFTPSTLNPNFFAYGQFPLYLGYFTLKIFHLPNSFPNSIFILRSYAALFSVLTVYFLTLISQKLFTKNSFLIAVALTIFNPGLIQIAHFGTTESLLVLIFLINIFLSYKIVDKNSSPLHILLAGIVSGIGIASKISAAIFIFPVMLAMLFSAIKTKKIARFILGIELLSLVTIIFGLILSPYNFINLKDFISTMNYETGVATGRTIVFYTSQFIHTPVYLFQLIKIFPYVSGLPQMLGGVLGLILVLSLFKTPQKSLKYWAIILSSSLIYFLYFGQLYVKWTRFMSPIFFIFPLFTAYFIAQFKSIKLRFLFVFASCLPGIFFFSLYFQPDIRLIASKWIVNNIPEKSQVLSEAGNVVDIPLINHNLNIKNLDFYGVDTNTELQSELLSQVISAEYIIVPSRRMFKNQYGPKFPVSSKYFQNLFSGRLGFTEIKRFSPFTDLIINGEDAEETWTVFDRPTIRIYKKTRSLPSMEYSAILNINSQINGEESSNN